MPLLPVHRMPDTHTLPVVSAYRHCEWVLPTHRAWISSASDRMLIKTCCCIPRIGAAAGHLIAGCLDVLALILVGRTLNRPIRCAMIVCFSEVELFEVIGTMLFTTPPLFPASTVEPDPILATLREFTARSGRCLEVGMSVGRIVVYSRTSRPGETHGSVYFGGFGGWWRA